MSNNRVQTTLAELLRNARLAKGMTQGDLASRAGIHRNVTSRLEAGGGHVASLVAASNALGMQIDGRSLVSGGSLGSRLFELRKRRCLSLRDVRRLSGISIPAITAMEYSSSGHVAVLEGVGRAIAAGLTLKPIERLGFWPDTAASSASEEWYTPSWLLERVVRAVGELDIDPCSPGRGKSAVRAALHLTRADDGLSHDWPGQVWLNPPYGTAIPQWLAKARHEIAVRNASAVLALIPARTDTRWWHEHVVGHADIIMLKGRVIFMGADTGAPFPSALLGYGLSNGQRDALFDAFPDAWRVAKMG